MKVKNFAINDVAIYQPGVTTGDTITMRFTHVTGGHNIDFEPVILSYASTFFTARIECVIDISQQDLLDGKIWLIDGDGYYNYEIKKNGSVIESGQLFIQAPEQITIENNPNNSVIITQFGAGSSGSSGFSGTNGVSGTAGVSGTSGQAGTSGISGTSGMNGSSGSSGANGNTGVAGSSGSSGADGNTGAPGSSGTSGANGAPGSSGSSGVNGSSGSSGQNGSSGSSGQTGVSGSSGSSGLTGSSGLSGTSGSSGQSGSSGSSGSNGIKGLQSWTALYSANIAETNGGTFIKTSGGDAFNAGIRSQEGFPTVYVSGKPAVPISTSRCYIGLDRTPGASNGWDDVDYLIGWSIGEIYIHEGGTTAMEVSQDLGIYPTDTTQYTVTYDGINVRYYVDNTLVRTVARSQSLGNLYMDGTIYNQGYGWTNVVFGPYGQTGVSGSSGSSGTSAGGGSATPIPSHLKEMFGVSAFSGVGNLGTVYKTSVLLTGFATGSRTFTAANNIIGALMPFADGTTITELRFYNQAAVAGSTVKIGIYKMAMVGSGSSAYFIPTDLVYTISSAGVDCSTTGAKTVTSLNYTLNHADTVGGMWMIGFLCSNTGMSIRTWTNAAQWTYNGDDQAGTLYRSGCVQVPAGSSSLPSILPTASMLTQTDVISVLYKSY